MRLRNKSWTSAFLKEHNEWLLQPNKLSPISSEKNFNNFKPLSLEIGCGKGQFITQLAKLNPHENFVAMEKEATVVGVALKKTINLDPDLDNLKFLNHYAENLEDYFLTNSVKKIYLNFSDPWPKSRHAKKRLTFTTFLNTYEKILIPQGEIQIKTDNDKLYEFSLEMVALNNWKILKQSTDLYNDQNLLKDNIPTEYETKFHQLGKNINYLLITKN
ncbi:tRNA (guanine-N(7)-)-methyltransferase [Spiroplasma sabaudiense Ar-1343]|uniref:tRNA (guanine-N(7)-)-methyltransferase n=1 Tax=Spiroplasma sabaudiense Ar-1343 TaxID=1276257 RepID=W6A8Z7_9MOLU|nr:tRNA (guanosine(46)-N7)-methyltransferase TrmB [Spiroplasma sabaudiense]AHI53487.1 tRNA (guanine-N(7)-)-methyltransferase [Spiroplasma sabaudiense Ar-1343]